MNRAIICLAVCAWATTALAAPPFTDPQVIKAPTPLEVRAVYPKEALAKRVSGVGTMRCLVLTTGRLSGCVALGENPAGQGFADAAVKLAGRYEYTAATENEALAEAQTTVEVRFDPPPQSLLQRHGVRALLLTAWLAVLIAFVVRQRRRSMAK